MRTSARGPAFFLFSAFGTGEGAYSSANIISSKYSHVFPKIYGKRPVWSHYNIRNCMVFMETRVSRTTKHVHTSSAGSVLENKVCDS